MDVGKGHVPRARLLPDGRLLVLRGAGMSERGCARHYSWDGELVWEHVFATSPYARRAYRYGYNYCPQSRALEQQGRG